MLGFYGYYCSFIFVSLFFELKLIRAICLSNYCFVIIVSTNPKPIVILTDHKLSPTVLNVGKDKIYFLKNQGFSITSSKEPN